MVFEGSQKESPRVPFWGCAIPQADGELPRFGRCLQGVFRDPLHGGEARLRLTGRLWVSKLGCGWVGVGIGLEP